MNIELSANDIDFRNQAYSLYHNGCEEMRNNKNESAIGYFIKVIETGYIKENSLTAKTQTNIGVCYQRLGNSLLAERHLNLAVLAEPKSSLVHYNLGDQMFKNDDYDKAILCFENAIELGYPDYDISSPADVYYMLANSRYHKSKSMSQNSMLDQYKRITELPKAYTEIVKAIEDNPNDVDYYFLAGRICKSLDGVYLLTRGINWVEQNSKTKYYLQIAANLGDLDAAKMLREF